MVLHDLGLREAGSDELADEIVALAKLSDIDVCFR
jgi:hypothetical protein